MYLEQVGAALHLCPDVDFTGRKPIAPPPPPLPRVYRLLRRVGKGQVVEPAAGLSHYHARQGALTHARNGPTDARDGGMRPRAGRGARKVIGRRLPPGAERGAFGAR